MAGQANAKPVLLLAVLIMVAGMGAGMYFMMAPMPAEPETVIREVPAPARAVEVDRPDRDAVEVRGSPVARTIEPAPPPDRSANRMARDLERERIWSALRREHELGPVVAGSAAPAEPASAELPSLDPEYIKSAIAEQLVPVARECYESALEDQPELAGKLVANFTIVGAEEVGGIVEEAEISEDSTLDSAFVRECMRESLMAVTFEPPTDGGSVQVSYPFIFEHE